MVKSKVFQLCLLAGLFNCPFLKSQIPTSGLIASYPFNTNANDESGNGNNGIVYDAELTTDRCGNPNCAYSFDGFQSQITINNSTTLNTMTRISLCAWIKPVDFYGVGNNSIIDKGYYSHENPFYQYHLGITGTDWPNHPSTFTFSVSVDFEFTQVFAGMWTPGLWYFVVGTYDGISLKLYINAELVDSLFKPGVIDRFGNDVYIGKFRNYPNAFTPGVIDDIKIYNRALSLEEILRLYYTYCSLGEINGETEVCQGQLQVRFSVRPLEGALNYAWNYSGTGATIHGNDDNIVIDFADNATSGFLTVTASGDYITTQTISVPIVVNTLPLDAGLIIGYNDVCQGQSGVSYTLPFIQNASGYQWHYSGTGATINGSSNSILIDFADDATSGNLAVTGQNGCGNGAKSADLQISINTCEKPTGLNIPNSFSPNGDGINDFFVIRGLMENSKLMIFNRSGKMLYESENYSNDWDGRDNEGIALESGAYWYVFQLSGVSSEFKGFVYIKR